jgi:hypothetical protein
VVVAHVKISWVKVIDCPFVPDASVSSLGPVDDERTKFDVTIDCIILKFLLFNLFKSVSKTIVHPVNEIHNSHRCLNQVDSWLSRDDTECDYTLHSDQNVMKLLYRYACHILDQFVLLLKGSFSLVNSFVEHFLDHFA